jgi:hypothetical protein
MGKRIPFGLMAAIGLETVFVGGNSCNRDTPNDIDMFPVGEYDFRLLDATCAEQNIEILSKTSNALTISYRGLVVQFCNFHHPNLKTLVESFDFAHIQIGVLADSSDNSILSSYVSPAWTKYHLLQSTAYIGSKYPVSSLIRSYKYVKRGDFSGKSYLFSVMAILADIVERGFENYKDFKDQLDAVDLGLLPEEYSAFDRSELLRFFNALRKDK